MQEVEISKLLEIQKNQMTSYIKSKQQQHPEMIGFITNRMILESLIFIKGYASAIEKDLVLPIIIKDLHELLLEQGYEYIKTQIG
jgi:hypothetical protein